MNASLSETAALMDTDAPMRVGRKLKRTLYLGECDPDAPETDLCVGIVDTEALVAEITKRWNQARWQRED